MVICDTSTFLKYVFKYDDWVYDLLHFNLIISHPQFHMFFCQAKISQNILLLYKC